MTAYLSDVESDLSAIHRIDDPAQHDGPRILRLAYRLAHYEGCVRHALLAEQRNRPAGPDTLDGEEITWIDATPEAVAGSPMACYFTFATTEQEVNPDA